MKARITGIRPRPTGLESDKKIFTFIQFQHCYVESAPFQPYLGLHITSQDIVNFQWVKTYLTFVILWQSYLESRAFEERIAKRTETIILMTEHL